jgi:hypothetical protein
VPLGGYALGSVVLGGNKQAAAIQYTETGAVRLTITPSGVEVPPVTAYSDAATVRLTFSLSSAELYIPQVVAPPVGTLGGPPIIPGPAPTRQLFRVIHKRHDETKLGEAFPSNLEFALYLGKVGFCNYDLDMSSALAVRQNTEAYGTDYELYLDDRVIQAGMHTDVQVDDIDGHTMSVSGKDWYHWFEKEEWPFDPLDPLANVYSQIDRDLFLIVQDMLTTIQAQPNTIQFTFGFGLSGILGKLKIDVADNEDMLSKITNFGQGDPGFDFEITWDKQINLWHPQKNRITNLVLEQGTNIYGFSYHDKGPVATHTTGTAQSNSSKLGVVVDDAAQTKFRRLMATTEFQNVTDAEQLATLTTGESGRNAVPHLEFTCKVVPDFLTDFFGIASLGDTIEVRADIGYDVIDGPFRLVSITGNPNDEGDQEYELGFDDGTISL